MAENRSISGYLRLVVGLDPGQDVVWVPVEVWFALDRSAWSCAGQRGGRRSGRRVGAVGTVRSRIYAVGVAQLSGPSESRTAHR